MSDNDFLSRAADRSGETNADREGLSAIVAAAANGKSEQPAQAAEISDASILNFALNLEYLEAEFYLRASGQTLPDDMTTGTGTRGEVSGGRQVAFQNPVTRKIATEIAAYEKAHVKFLRDALGDTAVSRPSISLDQSFTAAALAAGLIKPGEIIRRVRELSELSLRRIRFEDVGVTAFKGAAPLIANKTYLDAAAGMLTTEAYHGGIVRTSLYNEGMINDAVFDAVQKISNVRGAVDGVGDDDQGIGDSETLNLVPNDVDGRVFGRTPEHILNIVYLTPVRATSGGFYPNELNGALRESGQND